MAAVMVAHAPCHAYKRPRLDAPTACKNTGNNFTAIRLSATTSQASLETLPAEILDIILSFSAEASLIHASRVLRQKLPDYVSFTKQIAFEALLSLREWKDGDQIACAGGDKIAQIQSYLTLDAQSVVRENAFVTYWFRESHINFVRQVLLRWTILKACAVYFEKSPSSSQMRRIRSFIETQRTPEIGTDLNLRLRCENSRLVYLTATPFEVEVSERSNSVYQAFEFRVLDFGNMVPDFLLQHPLTQAKQAMIRGICKWKDAGTGKIRCNLDLLKTLILDCIIFDQLNTLYELLKLASSTEVVINLLHIERAVTLGRSRMLTPLLKQTWRQNNQHRLSDLQLIALIDQAKANGYANCDDTTRILAMEVAAIWKMAEIERAGGSVGRDFAEWPPRLNITMPGEICSQSWFIPKDPSHQIDWECSEFRGWIYMRMYSQTP